MIGDAQTGKNSDWVEMKEDGFLALVGQYLTRSVDGCVEYGFRVDRSHLNQVGIAHGGCLFTFLDSLMGWEAMRAVRYQCVTIQLDSHFMSSVKLGDFVTGIGAVVRETRNMVFMQGTIRVGDNVAMIGTGIWKKLQPLR